MRRMIAVVAAAGCLGAAQSAEARHLPALEFRIIDIGSLVAFDVDLCTRRAVRVRFEADFIQGSRAFAFSRWRGETFGEGCARIFLGVPDSRQSFLPGEVDARLRLSVAGAQRSSITRWRRFHVE